MPRRKGGGSSKWAACWIQQHWPCDQRGLSTGMAAIARSSFADVSISVITEAELRFGVARKPEAIRLKEGVEAFLRHVNVLLWDSEDDLKFPAAGNLAGNFFGRRLEFCKLCPKSAKLACNAGNGAGNIGNFDLSNSAHSTCMLFLGWAQVRSRDLAGNFGRHRGCRSTRTLAETHSRELA